MPEANKLSNVVTWGEGLPSIKSYDYLNKWSCNFTWQIKSYHLQLQITISTKLGEGDDLSWEAATLKVTLSYDHLTNVKSRGKLKEISPPSQDLWSLNLAGYWLPGRGSERKRLGRNQLLLIPFSVFFLNFFISLWYSFTSLQYFLNTLRNFLSLFSFSNFCFTSLQYLFLFFLRIFLFC